jgi:hypothetical protein
MGIGEAAGEGTRAAAEDWDGHGGRWAASRVGSHWHGGLIRQRRKRKERRRQSGETLAANEGQTVDGNEEDDGACGKCSGRGSGSGWTEGRSEPMARVIRDEQDGG